jgi:hypothetical protein
MSEKTYVLEGREADSPTPADSIPSPRLTAGQLLLAALIALAVTALWRKVLPTPPKPVGDAKQYLKMATDPSQVVLAPYAHRLLVPRLTYLIGGDPRLTFDRVSLACMVVTGPLVYALTRRLGAVHWAALLAMVGLLSTRGWTYYLYNPYLTDPAAMLLVALAFLALVCGYAWLLAPIGVAFAGVRELFVGLVAPAFGWLRGRFGIVRAALFAGLLMLPGWLVYQWIVHTVPSVHNPGFGQISWGTVVFAKHYIDARGGMGFFAVAAFTLSLGCWWVLAVPSLREPKIWRLLLWLLPVFGQFPLGGDWSRFALYAFPVIVPAAALTLQRQRPLWRGVIMAILGLQLLMPLVDMAAGRMTLNRPGPAVSVTVVLMALTAAVLIIALVSECRARPESELV